MRKVWKRCGASPPEPPFSNKQYGLRRRDSCPGLNNAEKSLTAFLSGLTCTLLYLKRITNKDLPYSTGNSAQCYVNNQSGKRIWKRIDACVCITESLCCTPVTIATFLVNDTKKKKKEMHKSEFISTHVTLTPKIQCSAVAPLY